MGWDGMGKNQFHDVHGNLSFFLSFVWFSDSVKEAGSSSSYSKQKGQGRQRE